MSEYNRRGFLTVAMSVAVSSLGFLQVTSSIGRRKQIIFKDTRSLIIKIDEIHVLCHRINGEWRVVAGGGDPEQLCKTAVKLGDTIYL